MSAVETMFIKRSSVVRVCQSVQGIITGFPALQCLVSVTMIIRLEASEAVTTVTDIKQFGGHKKINIYATENLNKYKSLSGLQKKAKGKDRMRINFVFAYRAVKLERLSFACFTERVGKEN